jgi:hypothetical protein
MVLGDKLFEESGNIIGLKITRVNPIEGVTTEVTFTSEIRRQVSKRQKPWNRYNDQIFTWCDGYHLARFIDDS